MGLKLFGKNIYQVYKHHIMKIEYNDLNEEPKVFNQHLLRKIKTNNITGELQLIGTTVTPSNLKRLITWNKGLCEGFILENLDGEGIGTIWILYRGSNDLEYRIRNIDAYIFDVYVNEAFRGKGYAGEMICLIMEYLYKKKGIHTAHLAVAMGNKSAIKAYEKVGFRTVTDKKFVRIMKINIPYHAL